MVVKVADFGLSRDIYEKDYYRVSNSRRPLPIKWMAIESLEAGIFSSKSDVVSFSLFYLEYTYVILIYYRICCKC